MSICGNVTSSVTGAVTGSVTGSNEGGCSGSKGVTFSGTEGIYAPNTVLTAPPLTMVCWATVPPSLSVAMSLAEEDVTGGEQFINMFLSPTGVQAYVRETSYAFSQVNHGASVGDLIHCAAVYNSSSSRIAYANGIAGPQSTIPQDVLGIDTIAVGHQRYAFNYRYYDGTLYHAAWYNRALSPTEIAELAAGANPRNYSGLVRYLPLAGAATAADELIEPSTWTTVGTLEDGDCATTVTEAYVPTAIDVKIGVSQHSLNASKGVTFSGLQRIQQSSIITDYPLTMVCWATVPPTVYESAMSIASADGAKYASLFASSAGVGAIAEDGSSPTFSMAVVAHGKSPGELFHIAAVFESSTSRISYADGVASPVNSVLEPLSDISVMVAGALGEFAGGRNYNADIYHAAWYNRALSPTEIAELAAGANPQDYAGLVRYLPLNGAANAASELIEPSTWTVTGTLADGAGDTTVTKQTFTNANLGGKTPKAALAFMTNATVADTVTDNAHLSLGATDGTNEWALASQVEDNVSTMSSHRYGANDKMLAALDDADPVTVEAAGAFDAFSADATAIDWTTAPPSAYLASMVQFAGDDVKAEAGTIALNATENSSVTVTLTDTSLNADLIIVGFLRNDLGGTVDTQANNCIGFATATGGSPDNFCAHKVSQYTGGTSAEAAVVRNDRCATAVTTARVQEASAEITSISAGSFDVTTRDDSAASQEITYLALSFGGAQVKAGTIETPTNAGVDWNVMGVGFQPQFVLNVFTGLAGAYNVVDTTGSANGISVSAFVDGFVASASIESALGLATTQTLSRSGPSMYNGNALGTTLLELSNPQMTADGWTVAAADIATANATARRGIYVAVEDVSE